MKKKKGKQLEIGETEEEYDKRIKKAKQDALNKIELRDDDLTQFIDTIGMEDLLVDIVTGFMEERKEDGEYYPPCFLVAIGQINPMDLDQKYVRRWMKVRNFETLLKVRESTEVGYWSGAVLFGYYEALLKEKQTKGVITFEDKFRSYIQIAYIPNMEKRLTKDNLIEVSKRVVDKFVKYMEKRREGSLVHDYSRSHSALKIYREEMEKRGLWRESKKRR